MGVLYGSPYRWLLFPSISLLLPVMIPRSMLSARLSHSVLLQNITHNNVFYLPVPEETMMVRCPDDIALVMFAKYLGNATNVKKCCTNVKQSSSLSGVREITLALELRVLLLLILTIRRGRFLSTCWRVPRTPEGRPHSNLQLDSSGGASNTKPHQKLSGTMGTGIDLWNHMLWESSWRMCSWSGYLRWAPCENCMVVMILPISRAELLMDSECQANLR